MDGARRRGVRVELGNGAALVIGGTASSGSSRGAGDLDRSLIRGLAWTGTSRWAAQVVSWASTLLLAHLLVPTDYGLIAMSAVYLSLMRLISEFGIGTTVITARELSRRQLAELNGLALFLGVVSMICSWAAAVPLGVFFRAPRLPHVILALSIGFPLAAIRSVPQAALQRELRFKLLAVIEAARVAAAAAAALTLALLGFGYWALVVNELAGIVTATALTLVWRRYRAAIPTRAGLQELIAFSSHVLGSRVFWYVYQNADFMVAGRVLGQAATGAYSMAWTLTNLPIEKVTTLVGGVAPAFFSAVQDDRAALRRYLLMLTEGLALVIFPATIGLALVAPDAVPVVIGQQWTATIAPLRLLAIYCTMHAAVPLLPHLLNVTGQSRFGMYSSLFAALILPVGFVVGSRWGTTGIAAAWVVLYPIVVTPVFVRVFRSLALGPLEYLAALRPALIGCSAMVTVVLAAGSLARGWAPAPRLALAIAAGGAAYASTVFAIHRERLVVLYQLVVRGKQTASVTG